MNSSSSSMDDSVAVTSSGAGMKEKESCIHVHDHKVYKSFEKLKVSLRCDRSHYLNCYGEYVKANKFDFLYSIWADWKGVEGGNQVVEEDAGNAKFVDPLEVSMVVMPYQRSLGIVHGSKNDTIEPKFCFICDEEMIHGKEVASLLASLDPGTGNPGTTHIIKCCNSRQRWSRRKRTGPVETNDGTIMQPIAFEEFHIFHLSCLVRWVLWNQRVIVCDDIDDEIMVELDEIVCPTCCTNSKGELIYSDSQMSIVKSKIREARDGWMNSPEELENSSIGLFFKHPSKHSSVDDTLELQVYRAEYEIAVAGADQDEGSDPDHGGTDQEEGSDPDHGGAYLDGGNYE